MLTEIEFLQALFGRLYFSYRVNSCVCRPVIILSRTDKQCASISVWKLVHKNGAFGFQWQSIGTIQVCIQHLVVRPKHFGLSAVDASNIPELDEWLQERQLMSKVVQLHLQRARDRMKRHTDKHRSERSFNVEDSLYLRLQPYIQSSVAVRSNNKLSFRFFGPFQIVERVGTVAYRL